MENFSFNIIKEFDSGPNPFEYIIYSFKSDNNIIIERDGKSIVTQSDQINKYLKQLVHQTPWKKCIGSYVKFNGDHIEHFVKLFDEDYRKVFLNININTELFVTNFKEIITENFSVTKNGNIINISGEFPIYQLFILGSVYDGNKNVVSQVKIFMKINDPITRKYTYYRFPYGNTETKDIACFGDFYGSYERSLENQYIKIITSTFNEHYGFHLRCNSVNKREILDGKQNNEPEIETTYNIEKIKEKISNEQFDKLSLLDGYYYLSQTNPEEIDTNILFKSPNIPEEILKYESNARQ